MVWNISKDKNTNNTNTRITWMASFGVFNVNVEDVSIYIQEIRGSTFSREYTSSTSENLRENNEFKSIQAGSYLFIANRWNTRTKCEICSKLSIKTPERCQRRSLNFWLWTDFINYSGVSTVNLEQVIAGREGQLKPWAKKLSLYRILHCNLLVIGIHLPKSAPKILN